MGPSIARPVAFGNPFVLASVVRRIASVDQHFGMNTVRQSKVARSVHPGRGGTSNPRAKSCIESFPNTLFSRGAWGEGLPFPLSERAFRR